MSVYIGLPGRLSGCTGIYRGALLPIGAQGSLYRGARAGPGPGACLPRGGGAYGGHKSLRGGGCPGLGGPQGLWGARSPRAPGRRSARSGVTAGPLRNGPGPGPGGGRRVPGMRLGLRLRPGSVPGRRGAAGGAGYRQGQSPTPRTREYFYYIDHQGQVRGDTGTPPPISALGAGEDGVSLGGAGPPQKIIDPEWDRDGGVPWRAGGGIPGGAQRDPRWIRGGAQGETGWITGRAQAEPGQTPKTTLNGPRRDPRQNPHGAKTDPRQIPDGYRTEPRQNPRQIPDKSQTEPTWSQDGSQTEPTADPRWILDRP